jgi:hypothetical protein
MCSEERDERMWRARNWDKPTRTMTEQARRDLGKTPWNIAETRAGVGARHALDAKEELDAAAVPGPTRNSLPSPRFGERGRG